MLKNYLFCLTLFLAQIGLAQIPGFPIDFDSGSVSYTFTDFDGGQSTVIANPQMNGLNTSANVAQMVKNSGQPWGGSLLTMANPIDFSVNKVFKVKVYSPRAGLRLLLKVEDLNNGAIFFEKEDTVTTANAWEELTFDFTAINTANQYSKLVFIFDNGVVGDGSPNFTFLYDDIELVQGSGGGGGSGATSPYCGTTVYHLGDAVNQVPTAINLTIANVNPTTMIVEIESADMDSVDLLLVNGAAGAMISPEDFSVPGKISRTLTWAAPPTTVDLNVLWSKQSFGGNWQLSPADITVNFADTCGSSSSGGATGLSPYCGTTSYHLGDSVNQVATAINLTIANVNPTTMIVEIESADMDSVDLLLVNGAAGAMISPEDFSVPGKISRTLTWAMPPATVDLNVLWSKQSFGGNWQLSPADITVNFADTCASMSSGGGPTGISPYCGTTSYHLGDSVNQIATAINLTIANVDPTTMIVEIESADMDSVDLLLVNGAAGAMISPEDFSVPGKISRTLTWAMPPATVDLNVLWSKQTFGGNWQLSPADITVNFADSCESMSSGGSMAISPYCETPSYHLGDSVNQVATAINLTIANVDPTTMIVEIESADMDSVDLLLVNGGSGAAISPEDFSIPGKISRTLTWTMPPATVDLNVLWSKQSFGGNWQLSPADITVNFIDSCGAPATGGKAQIDLPVIFDDSATVDYSLTDFAGAYSQLVADPAGGTNVVAQSVKSIGSLTFAGTTMGPMSGTGFANPVPFTFADTRLRARVYAPAAGIPVRLKVEDSNDPGIFVETEVLTTVANQWDTLVFNFSNPAMSTPPLNVNNTYDKASIFFHFGTDGMGIGADSVFYWDDVEFFPGGGSNKAPIDLPVVFDDSATVDYTLTDFAGAYSQLVADPTGGTNVVAQSVKSIGSQTFAGTTMGPPSGTGFANPIPFTTMDTRMRALVYSPAAGIPVRLKVENSGDPGISVETEVLTNVANQWDTLVFEFTNEAPGTAAFNAASTYDKASIFFHFGTDGAGIGGDSIFYWDNVEFLPGTTPAGPVKYCDSTVFHLGNPNEIPSSINLTIANTGPTSMIVEIESVDSDSVDFLLVNGGSGAMISPEDFSVPGKISRTLTWMTPPVDVTMNILWSKQSFGGNWQLSPADITVPFSSECDTIPVSTLDQIDLPVTFEDTATVDYTLTDFEGNVSMMTTDPAGGSNLVIRTVKTTGALTFAGTTMGPPSGTGFANPVPFTGTETFMNVRIYSPASGIPIRLKVEDANDPNISVETETLTTVANDWETLNFDFSNEVSGTPALNPANTYDKASIFFYFGTDGAGIGADSVYYWDDVQFGEFIFIGIDDLLELGFQAYPNPVQDVLALRADQAIESVSLTNQLGQTVLSREGLQQEAEINVSTLSPGLYFMNVKIGNTIGTVKIVKE